jgi:hypothetical protein
MVQGTRAQKKFIDADICPTGPPYFYPTPVVADSPIVRERERERERECESWSPWMGNRQAKLEGSPLDAEVALEESETNFLNFLETWKCLKLISKCFVCVYIHISCGKSQTR